MKTSHIRLFGISFWAFYYHERFGWFRLFDQITSLVGIFRNGKIGMSPV